MPNKKDIRLQRKLQAAKVRAAQVRSPMGAVGHAPRQSFAKAFYQERAKVKERTFKPAKNDIRQDGSQKGGGFLGTIKLKGGGIATEYTVGVPIDGVETDIPTLVPTLTEEELELMRTEIIPNRLPIPRSILMKSVEHAIDRRNRGLPIFYDPGID